VARFDQIGDQGDDAPDRLSSQRLGVWTAKPEPIGVLEVSPGHPLGKLPRRLPHPSRGVIDLVVDVGDVDDQLRPVPLRLQESRQQREDNERPRIPDVDTAIDRRPTGVDPDLSS